MLRKSWTVNGSTPADGATALDARLAQAGLYSRSADGTVRAGVLGARVGIVSSRSDMALDIDAFEAVLSRSKTYGVTPIANDGIVGVNLPAAPSSNSRWVRVYVIQRDNIDAADSTNAVEFGVVTGAAAAAPTLPALPPGALAIARVLQPANVLGTADCTVTEDFPMTAASGGLVPVRNAAERAAWTPDDSGSCVQLDIDARFARVNGAWLPEAGTVHAEYFNTGGAQIVPNAQDTTLTWGSGSEETGGFTQSAGVVTVPFAGRYLITADGQWATGGGDRALFATRNGVTERVAEDGRTGGAITLGHHLSRVVRLAANDTIRLRCYQTSGGGLGFGPLVNGRASISLDYLGA